MDVAVEADKRGGPFSGGHDAIARHTVEHGQAAGTDWNAKVGSWVDRLLSSRAAAGAHGHDAYGHAHKDGHGHDGGHHAGHRAGPGAGAVAAAGAAPGGGTVGQSVSRSVGLVTSTEL